VSELIPGLYEQLLTVELQRLVLALEACRADVGSPGLADAHIAVADHLRRLLERALHAVPEDERLTRLAEICNALLAYLRDEQRSASVEPTTRSSFTWRLRRPMPDDFFREAKVAAG
jgi:hypothetical protein